MLDECAVVSRHEDVLMRDLIEAVEIGSESERCITAPSILFFKVHRKVKFPSRTDCDCSAAGQIGDLFFLISCRVVAMSLSNLP